MIAQSSTHAHPSPALETVERERGDEGHEGRSLPTVQTKTANQSNIRLKVVRCDRSLLPDPNSRSANFADLKVCDRTDTAIADVLGAA